ncbi:hypothetical protein ARMSODRAFT_1027602 [Armillaria solidipes]|uniref:Uncharacterized protein n=1 Tax=Armillaria solidipes TaxID=1076256 RepID=A0A2H3AZQ7_9AGAR|nr:hypothetical protein ARMSODRAFT_1027602 [Armillaria solidipes]
MGSLPHKLYSTLSAGQRIPVMHITIPFLISALAVSASPARLGWRQVDYPTGSTTTDASTITSTGSTTTTFSTDSTITTISTFPTSTTTAASSPSSSYAPPGSLIGRAIGSDDTGEEYTCTCTPKSSITTHIGIPIQTGGVNEKGI